MKEIVAKSGIGSLKNENFFINFLFLSSIFFILFSLFYFLYSIFFILYSIFYFLYSIFFILFSLFYLLYSIFFILFSLFYFLYSIFFILDLLPSKLLFRHSPLHTRNFYFSTRISFHNPTNFHYIHSINTRNFYCFWIGFLFHKLVHVFIFYFHAC
jgi:hypothetical protein